MKFSRKTALTPYSSRGLRFELKRAQNIVISSNLKTKGPAISPCAGYPLPLRPIGPVIENRSNDFKSPGIAQATDHDCRIPVYVPVGMLHPRFEQCKDSIIAEGHARGH